MAETMDVPLIRSHRMPWPAIAMAAAAGALLILFLYGRGALPSVDRAGIVTARVERGPLVRDIAGTGTLVAAHSRIIAAETAGRVESIVTPAGRRTDGTTAVLLLSNPEAERELTDATAALDYAKAELVAARAEVEQNLIALRSEAARLEGELAEASAAEESLAQLEAEGLISAAELNVARVRAASLRKRVALAQNSLGTAQSAVDAQLAARTARISQAEAAHASRRRAVEALRVTSILGGIVQEVMVEPGTYVVAGQPLARVADPSALFARVHVTPASARDIAPGLEARVVTHAGTVRGRVSRVDPAVRNGSLAVDVELLDPLPAGVRPDSAVEAAIVLGRVDDALIVRRPANVADGSSSELFRIRDDTAERTTVSLGRGSAAVIEILHGLEPGDEIIVSDTTAMRQHTRLRVR